MNFEKHKRKMIVHPQNSLRWNYFYKTHYAAIFFLQKSPPKRGVGKIVFFNIV